MTTGTASNKKQSGKSRNRRRAAEILLTAIRHPEKTATFSEPDWDLFVRLARAEGLLARLAIQLQQTTPPGRIPQRATDHLTAARAIASNHARMIRWEVDRIQFALQALETPVLLLKGAAYLLAELPNANGRLVSDVDILVPENALHRVEKALLAAGWGALKLDEYDQRYYRRWMHELPPLRHQARGTVIDVHHRIVPRTSRLNPDPDLLWADSRPLPGTRLRVLSPEDMVLHCAVHLFHDGDLDHGLRDLVDLHDMFSLFGREPEFWPRLVDRARTLGVARPLFYALRYSRKLLATGIPAATLAAAGTAAPLWPARQLMDRLVERALTPEHPDYPATATAVARRLLYIRSHYLRMPLKLLIPHLLRKSFTKGPQTA